MPDNDRMDILVSVNDAYAMQLAVALTSLFETNEPTGITVWLLYMDLSEEKRRTLAELAETYGACLVQIEVDGSFFEGYPTAPYITQETYLRLLSGEVLPTDVKRVLWLDADLVVRKDLMPLYSADFAGHALIACAHGNDVPESMALYCAETGMNAGEYINAGVMLINLDVWRAIDMRAEIQRVTSENRVLKYADQDLVNLIFEGNIGFADADMYNFRTNRVLSDEDLRIARDDAAIIHYCGAFKKPWRLSDVPLGDVWREAYAKSPYGSKPLNLVSGEAFSRFVEKTKGLMGR